MKRLFQSLLPVFMLLSGTDVSAKPLYTDFKPDYVLQNGQFMLNIDLNNDHITDFTISYVYLGPTDIWMVFDTKDNNEVAMLGTAGNAAIKPFAANDRVGENETWKSGSSLPIAFRTDGVAEQGAWVGKGDAYIGMKLEKDGKFYYGWVRMNVNSQANVLTVKDMALEDEPEKSISPAASASGMEAQGPEQPAVQCYASGRILNVVNAGDRFKVWIMNLQGQLVLRTELPAGNSKLDLSTLPSGIYMAAIMADGQTTSRKILLE